MNLPKPLYELKPYILIALGVFAALSNHALWAKICAGAGIVCGLAILWVRSYKRKRRKIQQYSRDFK